ncbi:MAG TPA: hypothetical protein VGM44_07585 [Polyangiaceae bacterium]
MTTKKPALADAGDREPAEASSPDVALIHGVTSDGGYRILRARDNRLELGAVRPLREGVPISGEVVKLRPRENCPALCDVEVQFKAQESASDRQVPALDASTSHSGPVQVATDEYRKNWDAIWSRPVRAEKLVN